MMNALNDNADHPIQLLMTGPKLVFSFWLAQTLIPAFDKMIVGK